MSDSARKAPPKVSGLVKVGLLKPASEDAVQGLPEFTIGQPAIAKEPPEDSRQAQPPHEPVSLSDAKPALVAPPAADQGLCMIPLSRLKIHPFNSRAHRTQTRIEEVRDMLEAEHQQREPITVVPGRKAEDAGFFYILSGQTRYHAANLAGWTALKAQVNANIDPDDNLAFFAASIEHNTSVPETDWDLALRAKALVDEGVEAERVQKAIRKDGRGLRRLLAMTELPESVLNIVRENPTRLTAHVCEILRSAEKDLGLAEAADLAKEAVSLELSVRALIDKVELAKRQKARSGNKATRAKKEFMLPVCLNDGQPVGEFKVFLSPKSGNKVIYLNADLPDHLADVAKSQIAELIEKLAKDHGAR